MTLKEQTIKRIENQKEKNVEEQAEYGRVCVFSRLTLEYYENVLKDLEVLDILKSKAEIIGENDKVSLKINYINLFKDEFDKIKEWLENDRQRT